MSAAAAPADAADTAPADLSAAQVDAAAEVPLAVITDPTDTAIVSSGGHASSGDGGVAVGPAVIDRNAIVAGDNGGSVADTAAPDLMADDGDVTVVRPEETACVALWCSIQERASVI
jgi:hypothetical protein